MVASSASIAIARTLVDSILITDGLWEGEIRSLRLCSVRKGSTNGALKGSRGISERDFRLKKEENGGRVGINKQIAVRTKPASEASWLGDREKEGATRSFGRTVVISVQRHHPKT